MKQLIQICKSDLSGAEGAETVTVPAFEIDLTQKEKETLFKLLQPYLDNGTKVIGNKGPRVAQPVAASPHRTRADKEQTREERRWLNANGYTVRAQGRISQALKDAYQTRTPAAEVFDPHLTQAVADAELDNAEKAEGAHTRKASTIPAATFSAPSAAEARNNVTPIKSTRTRSTGGKVTAAATKAAPRKAASSKVASG